MKTFKKLWENFAPYADSNFITETQKQFHPRSWEMYMGNVLLKRNTLSEAKQKIKPRNEGPDFILNDGTYIGCIACSKGDQEKADSVRPPFYAKNPDEIMVQDVPIDKMILRITQALKDKAIDQYERWKKKKWFDAKAPFVIAINSGDLEWPQDYLGIPLIIKALFGLEFLQIDQNKNDSFTWRDEIQKGEGVPVTYFTGKDFSFVSGVIFSDQYVLNHPEKVGDDCIFVNNPFAQNPANLADFFKSWLATEHTLTKKY
ncbi:MAG: hypothetical protein U0519_01025 [Candidatus Gracilibacteria bacterium]